MLLDHLPLARQALLAPNGLDDSDLQRCLDRVLQHRVDFADLYLQSSRHESWSLEGGSVKSGHFGAEQGFGLRALREDEAAFAYAQQFSPEALREAADAVRSMAPTGGTLRVGTVPSAAQREALFGTDSPLQTADAASKIALLHEIDRRARALDPRVVQVFATLGASHDVVLVMRHDGRLAADVRPLVWLHTSVVVEQHGRRETCGTGRGGRHGLDGLALARIDDDLRRIVDTAVTNLSAQAAPAGTMPVVIGPGWNGVLLHEAIGHGLEGDFNRLGTSIYAGQIGQRVAAPGVTVVDNGALAQRRGSLNIDDEGEPTGCTTLVEDGVLCGYMQDSLNARLSGVAPTGNGRRQSYAHLPMPRMTNTYMLAGHTSPEEIIASVDRGLYLPTLGSGQVDIVSGQFSFEGQRAYLIENGRITAPVRGATLIGKGPEVIRRISMVGNDFALDPGMGLCGKSGQTLAVGVGQPTLRIDAMTVGGTG